MAKEKIIQQKRVLNKYLKKIEELIIFFNKKNYLFENEEKEIIIEMVESLETLYQTIKEAEMLPQKSMNRILNEATKQQILIKEIYF